MIERYQANIPFVGSDGKPTMVSQVFLEKLVTEVIALREANAALEVRVKALEP